MEYVKVYQLNEYDAVAAFSEGQAKEWYLETTGMTEDDAFEGYEGEVDFSYEVWEDESMKQKITVGEIVKQNWKGEPFIVFSTES